MCKEYRTTYLYSGGGCKIGVCDEVKYTADPCDEKPASGIRNCHRYQMIHSGSTRRKGPRPGHNHGDQGGNSSSA
ncbi:hypothetical protein BU23DRAFT_502671 [Bimuria novae-zelandiae CBS 107.79]|uniref:Uncharacterized protein n=1 Tax=Bimuria novae-zelandiae CBS 107.79 TaxID=1447943 RepID=A0A6A5VS23_9PLEO|nr:hypothetical protein BU23DRAFT_559723 [Bimuria novae-zelandiae CBS 107.79]KAF1976057.1 hypothetical protein BU23DRAFT_502671 [Bimuria novae-zelandiae CBS 107.79]